MSDEQRLYQITLTQTEFALMSGMYYIGEKLVTRRVNTEFNSTWGSVERAIQQEPESFATLEAKILAFAQAAAADMLEQQKPAVENPPGTGNGEVTG